MSKKRILSFILSFVMLSALIPPGCVLAAESKTSRRLYLHAQGTDPQSNSASSTIYMNETADIYFAVDDPNKGEYIDGIHKEPQYDMNGYSVTIYFDPSYFEYTSDESSPIDCTVPDAELSEGSTGESGYYIYHKGSEKNILINGKKYNSAYITVLFSGIFLPQKQNGKLWYNLCRLPLKPLKAGSTQVFFDTEGRSNYTDDSGQLHEGLELFAKDETGELENQTFSYTAVNGGYHNIVIKDRTKPAAPVANPPEGSYIEKQTVQLSAEAGCEIWYSVNGESAKLYTAPIEIASTAVITCYAKRLSDGKASTEVSYTYKILPKAPLLFCEKITSKTPIPNIYSEYNPFRAYVSDKDSYDNIEDTNEVYYTFSNISAENITNGSDPGTEWVKVNKQKPYIDIIQKHTVRLVTINVSGEISDVSEYHLGVKPAKVTADYPSGDYNTEFNVALSTVTPNAVIYYTTDGSDPIESGREYDGKITITKDTTLRAAAMYDGLYSEISSYYYIFTGFNDYRIDAFHPSGVYDGSVNVTLTADNPEITIQYRTNDNTIWIDYTNTLIFDKDTILHVRAIDKNGTPHEEQTPPFTYTIRPQPPKFVPENAQFTAPTDISIFCPDSTDETKDRYKLYYTVDGSDPVSSSSAKEATGEYSTAVVNISKYTVVKAVILKDDANYSRTVTQVYDIVNKKPAKPLVTMLPGSYTRKISDNTGFYTQFMPVPSGTEIYYTISYDGSFSPDPIPNTSGTLKYEGQPIDIKGHTIIKAAAVNGFGVKSDIGIFEYIISPEAPKAAPSSVICGSKLPVIPVSTVRGSTVKYEINGFTNEFFCENGSFYIDSNTGSAYADKDCTTLLGTVSNDVLSAPAVLNIRATLDGIESLVNSYKYSFAEDFPAAPYADKDTGEYEEIKADEDNNLLHIRLYSINYGDNIQYKTDNGQDWQTYNADEVIRINKDTVLRLRSEVNGKYSQTVSYVYNFIPLAPVITLPSGRYLKSENKFTMIEYDNRAPSDKVADDYTIMYRENGGKQDLPYQNQKRYIDHTMSFKAYVVNNKTGKSSKNTINYYIIEPESSADGTVDIANPYDVPRISADMLDTGEYAKGIKLLTQNKNAVIHYRYTYTQLGTEGEVSSSDDIIYENTPITVNPSMTGIKITAWLADNNGNEIAKSKREFTIEFVHLNVPQTSLGSNKAEFAKDTKYTIINDYADEDNILLYYTLDGSEPSDDTNTERILYKGEVLTLSNAVTVKAVYLSSCSECVMCKDNKPELCIYKIYGRTGAYNYTVPTTIHIGGGGGGSTGIGGQKTTDTTKKYTKDIFGNEHPTHIGYINGYPDGSVKPDGKITREETAAVLYRITNHKYEKPFSASGDVFSDVVTTRWSAHDIEYMTDKGIIYGYPDGSFKPESNLTRAEFAALICRFARLDGSDAENSFSDLNVSHWAYNDISALTASGFIQGYEDNTYHPENEITRAEVMTVINKILGRNPSEAYVKTLNFMPYSDLDKNKWYYTAVLEATITHNYLLDDKGIESKWDDCK